MPARLGLGMEANEGGFHDIIPPVFGTLAGQVAMADCAIDDDDYPGSLGCADVRDRRRGMLEEPRIAPLTKYAQALRRMGRGEVPDFDPLDGGVEAQTLFLLEKPGPVAAGSGFISRNNDDPTAKATFNFMDKARLKPSEYVIWNAVPWWNGTRRIRPAEREAGAEQLKELLKLLPGVRVFVLVGRKAQQAAPKVKGIKVIESYHPSPIVRARYPDKWRSIPKIWEEAKSYIEG